MKKIYYLLFFTLFVFITGIKGQYIWPIANEPIGHNILYKPQDVIDNELNIYNVFIKGEKGTMVLVPESGIVTNYSYIYFDNLAYCFVFPVDYDGITDKTSFDNKHRTIIADQLKIDKNLLFISISVETSSKDSYTISGIKPTHFLKKGSKVVKGDTLGVVGKSYHKIDAYTIKFSRSTNGMPIDPMAVFNLKSTFKTVQLQTVIDYSNYKHSPEALLKDFEVFEKSLFEGHPGLFDYISEQELRSKFQAVKLKLKTPMTSEEFKVYLNEIIYSIRDKHTAVYPVKYTLDTIPGLPIHFGLIGDSVEVYSSIDEYHPFIGKKLVKIGKNEVETIIDEVTKKNYSQEGSIKTIKHRKLLTDFWVAYVEKFEAYVYDSLQIVFSDNTNCKIIPDTYADSLFYPKIKKPFKFDEKTVIEDITNKVGYIKINDFLLLSSDREKIKHYIKKAVDSSYSGLIIDVRDNLGGKGAVVNELFSYFADTCWQEPLFWKANKTNYNELMNYSSNLSPNVDYFENFTKDETGYIHHGNVYRPNDSINFKGKLIVLVNEYSLSAATVFPALVKKYKRGTIIGRETGNCYHQMNAMLFPKIQLENTGLELFMPLIKAVFDTTDYEIIPYGRGVLPDVEIALSFQELVDVNPRFIEKSLEIINKDKKIFSYFNANRVYEILALLFVLFTTIFLIKFKRRV